MIDSPDLVISKVLTNITYENEHNGIVLWSKKRTSHKTCPL